MIHPCKDEDGYKVVIENPTQHTPLEHFDDSSKTAVVNPFVNNVPNSLNGIPFKAFDSTGHDWESDEGINHNIVEPELKTKRLSSGVIIKEPDGRYWIHEPTNHFAGVSNTFPKGKLERNLSLQANALKETFEETGLKARIIKHLGDVERTTSTARYYLGERIGGHPSKMGWESQSVKLVPKHLLKKYLNIHFDHDLVDKLDKNLLESLYQSI